MPNHPRRKKRNWPKILKDFRTKHNWTQKDLADQLKTTLKRIENWEQGIYEPPAFLEKALQKLDEECEKKS